MAMEGRIFLLCLTLSCVGAIIVDIPQDLYEFARGDNITLPCTFKTSVSSKLIIITWSAEVEQTAKPVTIITYFSNDGTIDTRAQYKGRASIDVNIAQGQANLKLSSITLDDNKVYECNVLIQSDNEPTPSDTTTLVVLVAPSTPICKVQGRAEYGQNINLTCVSQEGSPAPIYKWTSRDVNNNTRVPDPKTTDKGGILSLYNISKDTSGYFMCTSTNKIRSATCNLTLAVMPPSMNIGSTAGIVGGVAALLLLLIIVICCCCCRKKNKDEEYDMGDHEEYHDKAPSTNGQNPDLGRQEDIRTQDESLVKSSADRSDRNKEQSEAHYDHPSDYDDCRSDNKDRRRNNKDRRSDYDDRRSDYDDRRSDYNDHRSDYDDRRSDYDDRRSDYNDHRSDYDDRRSDYDDRRSDYEVRRDKYSDRHERYDDHDKPHDDRRPPLPALKPPKRDAR